MPMFLRAMHLSRRQFEAKFPHVARLLETLATLPAHTARRPLGVRHPHQPRREVYAFPADLGEGDSPSLIVPRRGTPSCPRAGTAAALTADERKG